jgi:hypothetical protein
MDEEILRWYEESIDQIDVADLEDAHEIQFEQEKA